MLVFSVDMREKFRRILYTRCTRAYFILYYPVSCHHHQHHHHHHHSSSYDDLYGSARSSRWILRIGRGWRKRIRMPTSISFYNILADGYIWYTIHIMYNKYTADAIYMYGMGYYRVWSVVLHRTIFEIYMNDERTFVRAGMFAISRVERNLKWRNMPVPLCIRIQCVITWYVTRFNGAKPCGCCT